MNLLQMAQRLHRETRSTTAAPTGLSGASDRHLRLFEAIQDCWRRLQNERRWRWMRTTIDKPLTIGQQAYSATDFGLTRFGRWRTEDDTYCPAIYLDGQPNTLMPLTFQQLDEFREEWVYLEHGNSSPIAWTFDETEQFLVGPPPAIAYKLRAEYWLEPSKLEADDAEPDMPERFHMLLVWMALVDIAKTDAKPEILAKAEDNRDEDHAALMRDQWMRLVV